MSGRRGVDTGAGDDEGFAVKRRKADSEADLDITPMIDVTFLLLIFFMVSSKMKADADMDIPVARFGKGVDAREATVVRIKAPPSPSEQPTILLGQNQDQEGTVDDVRRAVEEAVRDQRPHVIIKADREVPNGFVQTVARTVSGIEGAQFFVGVQDKPQPTRPEGTGPAP